MGGWRIEPARTGRGSCRVCKKTIREGEIRFGQDELNATWFHLKCAPQGAPRAFKPFVAKAAEIAKKGWSEAGPSKKAEKAPRNPELEKKLAADPFDEKTRLVYADWLQSVGDPWGEIIALSCAGKKKELQKAMRVHEPDLTAGLKGARGFYLQWRKGFLEFVKVTPKKPADTIPMLEKVFALRPAIALRRLTVDYPTDRKLVEFLDARAPKTVRLLMLEMGEGTGSLSLGGLDRLILDGLEHHDGATEELAGLGAGRRLPALTQLEIYGATPPAALEALIGGPLVRRLRALVLHADQPDESAEVLLRRRGELKHLPALYLKGRTSPRGKEAERAFSKQLEAYYEMPDPYLEDDDDY